MTAKIQEKIVDHRYDFVLLFDVKNGNPNGDPDAGNMPRLDSETMHGFVTDGCLKRKARDYVQLARSQANGNEAGYGIYVQHHNRGGLALNAQHEKAHKALNIKSSGDVSRDDIEKSRKWMCENFFDIRSFGAVMSTGVNCGQVRGPVQITFARSVDPIAPLEASITRVAFTTREKAESTKGMSEMGRKNFVPYALYMGYGFISPAMARDTGFSFADLDLLFNALVNMFDHDRSASRGLMGMKRLYVFQHASPLGNASAHRLFDRIERGYAGQKKTSLPRDFSDYPALSMDELRKGLPQGIILHELVEEGLSPTPWTR